MQGAIRFGGTGVKPKDAGAGDYTVREVYVIRSKWDAPVKEPQPGEPTHRPAYQLAVVLEGNDGKRSTGFYGSIYPNWVPGATDVPKQQRVNPANVVDYGFGNGQAKQFLMAWQKVTSRELASVYDVVGSRFFAEIIESFTGGKQSIKLFPKGPAQSAAPLVQPQAPAQTATPPANPAAALAALQSLAKPSAPGPDGAAAWAKLGADAQGIVKQTLAAGVAVGDVAKTLVETGLCADLPTATAAVTHAKGAA